jgi:hypothetical protein
MFGVAGKIGSRVAAEALSRGFHVVPVVRNPDRLDPAWSTKEFVVGDVTDSRSVAAAVKGMDAIISAVGPSVDDTLRNVTVAAGRRLDRRRARSGSAATADCGGCRQLGDRTGSSGSRCPQLSRTCQASICRPAGGAGHIPFAGKRPRLDLCQPAQSVRSRKSHRQVPHWFRPDDLRCQWRQHYFHGGLCRRTCR